jgi:hypothetical protein
MTEAANMINMVNSNCRFIYNEDAFRDAKLISPDDKNVNAAFHEERDKDKYLPDGETIAFVRSNFCELYHDKYESCRETKNTSNTKKNERKNANLNYSYSKTPKPTNKGSGDEFASSITFGVIHEGEVYEMRVFRRNTIGISGLLTPNKKVIVDIINKMIGYINSVDPKLNIKINGEPVITLCNAKYTIELPPCKTANSTSQFNLYLLNLLIREKYSDEEYWLGGKYSSLYNGITPYFHARVRCGTNTHLIKFYGNGKLNVYGGSDEKMVGSIINQFTSIIKNNYESLVQIESIPSRKKPLTDI